MIYRIFPPEEIVEAEVCVPLSKSVSARALIMQSVSGGKVEAGEPASCTDIDVLRRALSGSAQGTVDIADSGTALRFLTAFFAATPSSDIEITGSERLCQRPIGALVEALAAMGASIEYLGAHGCAPLRIHGRKLKGGAVTVDSTVSSQIISALMMMAPAMEQPLQIRFTGEPVSLSYIRLTAGMMEQAGVECDITPEGVSVSLGAYQPCRLESEADWSAAASWYEAVAVTSGFITVKGLTPCSAQPDAAAAEIFGRLGVTTDFDETPGSAELAGSPDVSPRLTIDLSNNPDLTPALAVTCSLIGVPFRFTGLSTLPTKECDRIAVLASELRKIGVETESGADMLSWNGRRMPIAEMPSFDPHGDHRMAMAFAFTGAYLPGIEIRDAEVVSKSYPEFWEELRRSGFRLEDVALQPAEDSEP